MVDRNRKVKLDSEQMVRLALAVRFLHKGILDAHRLRRSFPPTTQGREETIEKCREFDADLGHHFDMPNWSGSNEVFISDLLSKVVRPAVRWVKRGDFPLQPKPK